MPNITSAKKRVKVTAVRTARNKADMSELRTAIKKANLAIESNAENKNDAVKSAVKIIDRSAAKGLIHKNTAARRKSALAIKLKKA